MSAVKSKRVAIYAAKAAKNFTNPCQKAAAVKVANEARKASEAAIIAFKGAVEVAHAINVAHIIDVTHAGADTDNGITKCDYCHNEVCQSLFVGHFIFCSNLTENKFILNFLKIRLVIIALSECNFIFQRISYLSVKAYI